MSFNHYLSSLLLLCFSFPLLFPYANAFNITAILSQYPEFTTFNNLLTQTQLFNAINSRQTITVLVVENGNMAPLNGKSLDFIRKVLSVHVILDYYDVQKLENLPNKTTIVTTLYQASGLAAGQQGFLNVTILGTQTVAFHSAVPGSNLNSNLVKSIALQPYNISVLQVSNLVVPPSTNGSPPGNGNSNSSSNSTTSPSPSSVPPPASTPKSAPTPKTPSTVTPASAPKASPKASPPVPTVVAPTPSTADTPATDTPTSDAPVASPPGPTGLAPPADDPTAEAPAGDSPAKNAAAKSNAGTWVSLFVMSLSTTCWIV